MKYIDEKSFLKIMKSVGIIPCREGANLCYEDVENVMGFDFTNLAEPDTSMSLMERQGVGDRSVEYAMVGAMLRILDELGLFPLYLYAADEEWAGEEIGPLTRRGFITAEEGAILESVMDGGHGMDVIVVDRNEIASAARLVTPQLTVLGASCAAADENGRALTLFSQDDEVAFNTTDRDIYEKALEMVRKLKGLPFEVVFVEN